MQWGPLPSGLTSSNEPMHLQWQEGLGAPGTCQVRPRLSQNADDSHPVSLTWVRARFISWELAG